MDAGWTIGGKPNGGYLLAMLTRAAGAVGPHPHVLGASAHYLRSPEPGAVTVEAEVLRAGRSASQLRCRMTQEGRPCVEALVTTGRLDPGDRPYWQAGLPPRSDTGFEDCERPDGPGPTGPAVALLDQIGMRLEPAAAGSRTGSPRGRGELRGWLALPGDQVFTPDALVFAVDSFPPGTIDVEHAGWVPTLELTVYVRALASPGPVQVLQQARLIDGGRVDEACFVWDGTGRLVAQGTQLAVIRLGRP